VIEVERVSVRFGRVQALDEVSLRVGRGEVVGFLGENGAGKTTTLRVVTGFLAPDRGAVRVDGIDVQREPRRAQRRLGYLAEGAPACAEMRVGDYLRYRAALKGLRGARARAAVDGALRAAQVADVAARRAGALSRGTRQRVALADALLGEPPILVLDEPTGGLDPNQARDARALIAELARERTVLLSTHILSEVEALAARVVVLARGRVVGGGELAALRGAGRTRARVRAADVAAACALLAAAPAAPGGELVTDLAPAEVARRLVGAGIDLLALAPETRSLEQVFHDLTRAEAPP
jgi:gliding motility-associated transport system ATP-binding protein